MQQVYLRIGDLTSAPERKEEPGRKAKPGRKGRYPWTASTVWRAVKAGKFPQPIKVLGSAVWPLTVIEQWEAEQLAAHAPTVSEQKVLAAAASVVARRAKRAEAAEGVAP